MKRHSTSLTRRTVLTALATLSTLPLAPTALAQGQQTSDPRRADLCVCAFSTLTVA